MAEFSGIVYLDLTISVRALAAQAVRAFASFEAEPGLKFDKIYPVYSQRFQKDDLEEGGKWDPSAVAERVAAEIWSWCAARFASSGSPPSLPGERLILRWFSYSRSAVGRPGAARCLVPTAARGGA